MPSITIDGKTCHFEGKKTILQVALENDIQIPHYCYHPGLSVVASCRICLAEVAQPNPRNDNKLELIPKLLPTCQTPAVDGAEVYTTSEKSRANQKAVMEYLLVNHPLDCPVCDQAGECYLQDYSYQYGRAHSRFEEDKIKQPKKDIGPNVYLYGDRCIMCSRCVRFCREVTGTSELCVTGRGASEEIDVFPGRALDNPLSVNVADICPVGALLDKDFLFERRVWELTSSPGIDGLTCSGDNVWIDHADGRIYRFKPRTNMDVNKWWISDEIRYAWHHVHGEDRLTDPCIRRNDKSQPVTWAQAINEALSRLRQVVADNKRLALMVSPMLTCEDAYWLATMIRAVDANALLVEGPVPMVGQKQTFPGGYTIYPEKAPNARGVRRVVEQVCGFGNVIKYDESIDRLFSADESIGGVVFTGNYPSAWVSDELSGGLGERLLVLIDTLPNKLTERADVLLPAATWCEKAGTFENIHNRLQAFDRAIRPLEWARPEAQIALDIMTAAQLDHPGQYDPAQTRRSMGQPFAELLPPARISAQADSQMQFVEL